MKRSFGWIPVVSLLVAVPPHGAMAVPLSTWSWSGTVSGGAVSGRAAFSVVPDGGGWDLVINVSNTAATSPTTTAQILRGVYFDMSLVTSALTMSSAVATGGILSALNQTIPDAGSLNTNICAPGHGGTAPNPSCSTTVPGGWEAAYDASGLNGGAVTEHWGVGTSGQSGKYGIAPGNNVGDGSGGGLTGMLPYTYASAVFTLSGLTTDQITIFNVLGAYGTLPEGTPAGVITSSVTEPASAALLLVGGIGLARARRNKRLA